MIDLEAEQLIDLRAACRETPLRNYRTGRPCHVASAYRYVLRGALAVNGERVQLEVIKTPSGFKTSREAVHRFIARLTNPATPTTATSSTRQRQIDAACDELRVAGVME